MQCATHRTGLETQHHHLPRCLKALQEDLHFIPWKKKSDLNTEVVTKVIATALHREQWWGRGGLVRNVWERPQIDKSLSQAILPTRQMDLYFTVLHSLFCKVMF